MIEFKKEQLIKMRELKGMNQAKFGDFLGVSRPVVYHWECGESLPSCLMLCVISDKCGIPIQSLFGEA